ncbi:MAG: hypothetical protein J1E64_12580 [Acetatifactor sp.]|nr:hypothetical protein [Acetatifactor sp.]
MLYDRKIKYLEYMENGERIRGAGFVKAELRDTLCRMKINVTGLHETDCFEKQVLLVADKQESFLCKIRIESGKGDAGELVLDSRNLGGSGISYNRLEEIRIPVAAGKELRCRWQEKKTKEMVPVSGLQRESMNILPETEETKIEIPEERLFNAEGSGVESINLVAADTETKDTESVTTEKEEEKEPEIKVIAWKSQPEIRMSEKEEPRKNEQSHMFPLDDKWKQLSAIYPHIAPFEDERDYLSLGPSDFVIFPSRYYRVVNNSFLLHGYHNYRHLILARMESRGEIRYYVGVPGNFYEKEKQVALMFGFESFECKQEPARSGDYGYYMMRVEL